MINVDEQKNKNKSTLREIVFIAYLIIWSVVVVIVGVDLRIHGRKCGRVDCRVDSGVDGRVDCRVEKIVE